MEELGESAAASCLPARPRGALTRERCAYVCVGCVSVRVQKVNAKSVRMCASVHRCSV